MRIKRKFFHNRLARRIFFLFIISALIPVIVLAAFQMVNLSHELNESSQLQVRRDVKNIGTELIARLFNLESQLKLLGRALGAMSSTSSIHDYINIKSLNLDFNALTLIPKAGLPVSLQGDVIVQPDGMPALAVGHSWLTVKPDLVDAINQIIVVHRPNLKYHLLGLAAENMIWNFGLDTGTLLWVLDADGRLVYANTSVARPQALTAYTAHKDSDTFDWEKRRMQYVVGYWKLSLSSRFLGENWVIAIAEPKPSMFVFAPTLYTIFLPTVILALLLSLFLSRAQIRRSLTPLIELGKATRRIAKRDFKTPVNVHSGDEFEELGQAFNSMSKQLQQQFQTLSILSVLDQSIISTQDGDEVLHIIFELLKELVDYDFLILGVLQRHDEHAVQLWIDDRVSPQVKSKTGYITDDEIERFRQKKQIILDLGVDSSPTYLTGLNELNIQHVIIFPILHRHQPNAFICLGFHKMSALIANNTKELHDIFYRASVAYTHAEWEQQLYWQAHYDDLTHLPNRLVLRDKLHQSLEHSAANGDQCVLMFIDLDNFKDVNDTQGHATGDRFLAIIARTMQDALGDSGLLARIGGDEFTVLITGFASVALAEETAIDVAEKLLQSISKPFELDGVEFHASTSIGIVIYPHDCNDADELLKCADLAMYKAKESGKNCYVFFSKDLGDVVQERTQLLQEMHTAMREDQFSLVFQPKIDCCDNSLVGAEVLIRWQHPTRGLLTPDTFLHIAEDSNFIFAINDWVLRIACLQLIAWREAGLKPLRLAINLAARQFKESDLADTIQRIIEETGVDPSDFEFEVTEGTFIESFAETNLILNQLNAIGSLIAIDDFGTGYSSLRYLRMLPVHALKIDRAFVQGLPDDQKNISIISAIMTLANNMNIKVIAEGMETKAQSDALCKLGCTIQQGYYFSKPLTADEFASRYLLPQDK